MEGSQRELRDDGFSCELQGLLVLVLSYHILLLSIDISYIYIYMIWINQASINSKLDILIFAFAVVVNMCGLIFGIYVAQKDITARMAGLARWGSYYEINWAAQARAGISSWMQLSTWLLAILQIATRTLAELIL